MSEIYPKQTRCIDPYSSYDSNVTNKLTRMVTFGRDCIYSPHSVDVIIDPAHPSDHVIVTTGQLFMDDVIISIDEDFNVDMTDASFYLAGSPFNETGIYWIVAEYRYAKSRPAPQMGIRILKPTQHNLFSADHLFLKAVKVVLSGTDLVIDSLYDTDPDESSIGKRVYTYLYAGCEDGLPSFLVSRDEGRLVYVRNKRSLYLGVNGEWEALDSVRDVVDTTACLLGQVVYMGNDGKAYPASSSTLLKNGWGIVTSVGLASDGSGQVKLSGRVDNVVVESGVSISISDDLWLSETEDGSVTNIEPLSSDRVYIGKAVSSGTEKVSVWLCPQVKPSSGTKVYRHTQSTASKTWNINHNLGNRVVSVQVYDSSYKQIFPSDIQLTSTTSCQVTFPTDVAGYAIIVG